MRRCNICRRDFKTSRGLSVHRSYVHNVYSDRHKSKKKIEEWEKPQQSLLDKICDYLFSR